MNQNYLTVTAVNRYLKYKIDNDDHLQNIYIKGEISNFKAHTRGHYYFTLKDEESRISAIMFASSAQKLPFIPQDGMKVLVYGKISVYESTGNYQIYVQEMLEDGLGNLFLAFEQLKIKLDKEGLFDPSKKKPIPYLPQKIGIITASTGAAIKDVLSTINRRFPNTKTILFPTLVQGEKAHLNIIKQLEIAQTYDLDVIILGRGGGSLEDLWPFNEELLARAIYKCDIPIISAVGHEVDFTISDFVADVRAATPTAAAELAVPNIIDVLNQIDNYKIRSSKQIKNKLENLKEKLFVLQNNYVLKNPINIIQIKEQTFTNLLDKINSLMLNNLEKKKNLFSKLTDNYILNNPIKLFEQKNNYLQKLIEKLEVLNPLNTLKRGYAIVRQNDLAITSIKHLKIDDIIKVELKDGQAHSKIIKIEEK